MNWTTATILGLGLLIWYSRRSRHVPKATRAKAAKTPEFTDEQFDSLIVEKEPKKMAAALKQVSHPLHRHQLLTALIRHYYPKRDQAQARTHLYQYGKVYLAEFKGLAPSLKKEAAPEQAEAPALKCLAIAMEEDHRFDEALDICRTAQQWNIEDGTKTGYAGRMRRIQKKQTTH
jgi:hypothetical protein